MPWVESGHAAVYLGVSERSIKEWAARAAVEWAAGKSPGIVPGDTARV